MRLESIGFYTLSDARCAQACATSRVWRCEILLTDRCNFRCPYCRGLPQAPGDAEHADVLRIVDVVRPKNLRLSGGEPTLYRRLDEIVREARRLGTERVAVSTNGSALRAVYRRLLDAGVDDFSVSLDACCAGTGATMSGVHGAWERVVENVRWLAARTYVTVGVVYTEANEEEAQGTVDLALSLGVADVRVIPAAQGSGRLRSLRVGGNAAPILSYRADGATQGENVRGLRENDNRRCPLVLDDLAIAGGQHYPCVIYLREQGAPIGPMTNGWRAARAAWWRAHDCWSDPICRANCLDVCRAYNNRWLELRQLNLPRLNAALFTAQNWRLGGDTLSTFGASVRWRSVQDDATLRAKIRARAIGWCRAESLACRPKENAVALMVRTPEGGEGWFHLRADEAWEVFGDKVRVTVEKGAPDAD